MDEHEAFAASRVTQYVFCPTKADFTKTLDQHADTGDKDVKLPLVVVGNDGSGKSALLANWVAKRREHLHRDEFLFQHYVGCTTPSLELAHTLSRLETKLKEFYRLREMNVPDSEEDLRWSLGRFLQNAAKVHNPARIIIIIDGVNRLACENMPNGALHWLPTELPPCVRFILSTVELERVPRGGGGDAAQHRSFVELTRRKCPLLRIEPLNQQIRSNVIHEFLNMNKHSISLSEQQQFKIISAPATSQPMYLRSLLQAVSMCSRLTSSSVDQLLETFLHCSTAHELVDKNLNICCQSVFPEGGDSDGPDEKAKMELLGKIFTIVYVSRTGLTEAEIWGVIKMVTSIHIEETACKTLMSILSEFSMVVSGMYSFSHEIYREVVYNKYVCSKDNLIRWHQLMARYFSQLQTGPRKLTSLPYHLETAGSWSKVKNCLTDINMFQWWWTRDFKADFIKTWALLTKVPQKPIPSYSTTAKVTNAHKEEKKREPSRPTYDIVEEYVKSLDEWRTKEHPNPERVSTIILLIADFLLEFATLGHEVAADVPNIIHPVVPSEDLKALGVPHVTVDKAGRSVLWFPQVYSEMAGVPEGDDGGSGAGNVSKAIEDIPFCTTYFFHRWMWIQFPYIALGNCDSRYLEGENMKKNAFKTRGLTQSHTASKMPETKDLDPIKEEGSAKFGNTNAFKLPEIKFNRKAARSHRRVPAEGADALQDQFNQRMESLQDDIQNYREEYDFVMQMKSGLRKRLAELSGQLETLKRSAESVHQFDDAMADAKKRDVIAANKFESVQLLNKNLKLLSQMCDRHPANVPALIIEIENKIKQDAFLLAEIKKRLWEQKFEYQMHQSNFKIMKFLKKKGEQMHNKLLNYRIVMKMDLKRQADRYDEEKASRELQIEAAAKKTKNKKALQNGDGNGDNSMVEEGANAVIMSGEDTPGQSWEEMWQIITSRTGIAEPGVFFDRLRNGSEIKETIKTLRETAEQRLENLKNEVKSVEQELEVSRLATMEGVVEESDKLQKQQLVEDEKSLRGIKEKAEGQEQLEQTVISGLGHLGELLGVPHHDDDTPVSDLLRDIETMIDTLMDEREKQLQQQSNNVLDASSSRLIKDQTQSPEINNRPPELDVVLARFESPKLRLPGNLPSRPCHDPIDASMIEREDDDDDEEEGTWDRGYILNQSKMLTKKMKPKAQDPGKDTVPAPGGK